MEQEQKLERKYFTRKEVANYFGISTDTLVKIIYDNGFKETFITGKQDERGHKCIRISNDLIKKLELKFNK